MPVRPSCGMALVRFLRHGAAGSAQDRSGSRVSIGPLRQPGGDRRQTETGTAAACAGSGLCREQPTVTPARETLRAEGGGPTLMLQYRSQVWAGGLAEGKGAGDTEDAVAAVYQCGGEYLTDVFRA